MFKYLINVFVLLASFSCKAYLPEPIVLLKCNLESGSSLLAQYDDLKFVIYKGEESYITKREDVLYNDTFRFQSEYTIVKLDNQMSLFKSFDATFSDDIEYGFINSLGKVDACKDVISENFSKLEGDFERDKSGL
ncbi:hypothetical protein [Aliivibrio fischeri]|uniref:hypothetical protein n=1 Tax=Aliivibrio fischeri TaxID=668 RepID=UPI0007C54342|nr:hypothetical protein [Aliivibrio fischeri]